VADFGHLPARGKFFHVSRRNAQLEHSPPIP
jgi:hypothetical protein